MNNTRSDRVERADRRLNHFIMWMAGVFLASGLADLGLGPQIGFQYTIAGSIVLLAIVLADEWRATRGDRS